VFQLSVKLHVVGLPLKLVWLLLCTDAFSWDSVPLPWKGEGKGMLIVSDQCGNMGLSVAFLTKIWVRDQGREMVELRSAEMTYIHLRSMENSIFVFFLPL